MFLNFFWGGGVGAGGVHQCETPVMFPTITTEWKMSQKSPTRRAITYQNKFSQCVSFKAGILTLCTKLEMNLAFHKSIVVLFVSLIKMQRLDSSLVPTIRESKKDT